MVEGISELPTVLTSFETLDEAQQLLDESGPFAQLFVTAVLHHLDPLHHRRYEIGVERRDARRARLTGRFLRRNAGRDEAAARLPRRRADVPQRPLLASASTRPAAPRRAPLDGVRIV